MAIHSQTKKEHKKTKKTNVGVYLPLPITPNFYTNTSKSSGIELKNRPIDFIFYTKLKG
jgi:hypothetical protein